MIRDMLMLVEGKNPPPILTDQATPKEDYGGV